MNKKKIATLLLVGTLLIGGGVLGAKAWFTSDAKVTSNLRVTMGTLELKAEGDDVWEVGNKSGNHLDNPNMVTEIDNPTAGNDYTNVRPGDEFVKNVILKNVGSLKSRTTFKLDQKAMPKELEGKVTVEIKEGDNDLTNNTIIMYPQEEKNIAVAVKLDGPAMENEFQNRTKEGTTIGTLHQTLVKFLDSNTSFIDVSGIQVNATTPQQ